MAAAHRGAADQVQIAFAGLVEDVRILVEDREHHVARLGALLVRAVVDQLRIDEAGIDVLGLELEQLLEGELGADEVLVLNVFVGERPDLADDRLELSVVVEGSGAHVAGSPLSLVAFRPLAQLARPPEPCIAKCPVESSSTGIAAREWDVPTMTSGY